MGIFDDLPLPPEKSVSYISSVSDLDLFIYCNEAHTLLGLDVSDTYNYTELCDFLKLLVVSVSVLCPVSVSVSVLHRFIAIAFIMCCIEYSFI